MKIAKATLNKIRFYLQNEVHLKEILDREEYQSVRSKNQDDYIQDKLVEYNPNGVFQSFRIQKVITDDLDLNEFLDNILELITPVFKVNLDCGYFICKPMQPNSLVFSFPSKTNSFLKRTIKTVEDLDDCLGRFKKIEPDLLHHVFEHHRLRNDQFNESGFIPTKLVVLHIYVTKF